MFFNKHFVVITSCVIIMLLVFLKGLTRKQFKADPKQLTINKELQIKKAPFFELSDINGTLIKLSDLKGKIVILGFMASWCPPCIQEIPNFIELQKKYKDDLVILGVSLDKNPEKMKELMLSHGINFPMILGTKELTDNYGGVFSVPTNFILDKNLNIIKKSTGFHQKTFFEELIQDLLQG